MEASQVAVVVKNLPANAEEVRDMSSIPGLGRSPGRGNGNPLQCRFLENPMDKRAWWATVYRVAKLDTTEATQHAHAREAKVLSYKNITDTTQQNLVEVEDIPAELSP